MNRFRPNIVIAGTEADDLAGKPWAEDDWSAIAVGPARSSVLFGVVKPCARCKIPTIDQFTGVPDGRSSSAPTSGDDDDDEGGGPTAEAEPTSTLRAFRSGKVLGFQKKRAADVFFGQNLTVHSPAGSTIAVGDSVLATPDGRTWGERGF